ncbi:penicillin-binding protein 2 [bacterium]|nr:penicillin-binding protein 2 [bacterium]
MNKLSLTQILLFILLLGFAILVIALAKLQIIDGGQYTEYAENNYIKKRRLDANRGEIYDRNGLPIAQNYPAINLAIVPGFIEDKDSLKTFLSTFIDVSDEDIDNFLYETRFRQFQENIFSYNLKEKQVAKIAEHINFFPELRFVISNTRKYHIPNHFTGYIGRINQQEYAILKDQDYHYNSYLGKTGIEKQYEAILKGVDGVKLDLVNAKGRNLDLFRGISNNRDVINIEPINGMDLNLTIDLKLQQMIDDTFPPDLNGAVVVMNYENGEVLAYVSRPEFDQNIFMSKIPTTVWDSIRSNPSQPFLDRVSKAVYPPGSVFKILTAGYGLENKIVNRWTKLSYCDGGMQIGNRYVKCWNHFGHGSLNVIDALKVSCDVYFYDLSFRMDLDNFCYFVKDSMLSEKTGIDIPDEAKGFFPTTQWYIDAYGKYVSIRGQMVNLSIGQGEMYMTPLQICALYAGIANDGLWIKPHLLKKASRGQEILTFDDFMQNREIKLPFSDENIAIIQESLRKVITNYDGTAHSINRPNRNIYGKTGSAEHKVGSVTHAWFSGYDKDTKIAISVFVQEGGGGGSVAAPIAGQVFDFYYNYLGNNNAKN